MAIFRGNDKLYEGCVVGAYSHMWMDGMEEETAVVWDPLAEDVKTILVGYYGADGFNLAGMGYSIDATQETLRALRRHVKLKAAQKYARDLYTEKERMINYIESFHDFPSDYKGKRNYRMFRDIEGDWNAKFAFDANGDLYVM